MAYFLMQCTLSDALLPVLIHRSLSEPSLPVCRSIATLGESGTRAREVWYAVAMKPLARLDASKKSGGCGYGVVGWGCGVGYGGDWVATHPHTLHTPLHPPNPSTRSVGKKNVCLDAKGVRCCTVTGGWLAGVQQMCVHLDSAPRQQDTSTAGRGRAIGGP